jgi:hypothetical protein
MSNSSAIIIGGQLPKTYWNGIADMGLLLAIDELRDQVFAVIKAAQPAQPQVEHDPSLDYGTRA